MELDTAPSRHPAQHPEAPGAPIAPSKTATQLSARYRNFLVPFLALGAWGGVSALLAEWFRMVEPGWWPIVWLVMLFAGVFFSAAFMITAGRRRLSIPYGIAIATIVSSLSTTHMVLLTGLRASSGILLPAWIHTAPARHWLEWDWAPLLPWGAGLTAHGVTMLWLAMATRHRLVNRTALSERPA